MQPLSAGANIARQLKSKDCTESLSGEEVFFLFLDMFFEHHDQMIFIYEPNKMCKQIIMFASHRTVVFGQTKICLGKNQLNTGTPVRYCMGFAGSFVSVSIFPCVYQSPILNHLMQMKEHHEDP